MSPLDIPVRRAVCAPVRRPPRRLPIVCEPPYNAVCPGLPRRRCSTIIPRHRPHCSACARLIEEEA